MRFFCSLVVFICLFVPSVEASKYTMDFKKDREIVEVSNIKQVESSTKYLERKIIEVNDQVARLKEKVSSMENLIEKINKNMEELKLGSKEKNG